MLALRPDQDEDEVVARAAEAGARVGQAAPCWVGPPAYAALLLGYTALPLERIDGGLRRLARALA
jgi:DNA-binding transcriptional MocR family regulator